MNKYTLSMEIDASSMAQALQVAREAPTDFSPDEADRVARLGIREYALTEWEDGEVLRELALRTGGLA